MTDSQFQAFINDIRHSYQLRSLPDEVMEFMYSKIGSIPHESTKWITDKFLASYEKFPLKLHSAIEWLYQEWLSAHPEKRTKSVEYNKVCKVKECEEGLLTVWKDGYRFLFRCECGRSDLTGIPMSSMYELQKKGYRPDSEAELQAAAELHALKTITTKPEVKPKQNPEVSIGQLVKAWEENRHGTNAQ